MTLHWYWQQVEGNVLAVPLCAVLAAVLGAVVYALRDHIGRRLARWWDKHQGPLAVERHKQAMREVHGGERLQSGSRGGAAVARQVHALRGRRFESAPRNWRAPPATIGGWPGCGARRPFKGRGARCGLST